MQWPSGGTLTQDPALQPQSVRADSSKPGGILVSAPAYERSTFS